MLSYANGNGLCALNVLNFDPNTNRNTLWHLEMIRALRSLGQPTFRAIHLARSEGIASVHHWIQLLNHLIILTVIIASMLPPKFSYFLQTILYDIKCV